jgi:hypothetical protein
MQGVGNVLLVALVCATIGFVIGALVVVLWFERERSAAEQAAEQATLPEKIRTGHYQPVARLWRERGSGRLEVEVDGEVYAEARALKRGMQPPLVKAAQEWVNWLGIQAARPSPTQPLPPASTPVPASAPAPSPAEIRAAVVAPPAAVPAVKAPAVEDVKPAAPKSIVEQIDEVLQELLEKSDLSTRAIRLVQDASHGVVVWVALEHYNGIDAVPDPEIKAVIQKAVAEWERRTERK